MSTQYQQENWFFIRGLVRESGHWHDFVEKFQKTFPHRKVFLLDLPGNGAHYLEKSPYSVPAMAAFLRNEFLKKQTTPNAKNYIFSISLGSMVCMEWMHTYPSDVEGAVLVNTSLRGLSPFYRRLRPQNYFTILKLFVTKDPSTVEKEILRITSNDRSHHEEIAKEWLKIQEQRPVSKRNAIAQIIAAVRYHPPAEKPRAKTLLLASYGDQLVHCSCTKKIQKLWNVEAHYHDTAGHDLTLDAGDWVLERIKNLS